MDIDNTAAIQSLDIALSGAAYRAESHFRALARRTRNRMPELAAQSRTKLESELRHMATLGRREAELLEARVRAARGE